MKKKLFLFLLVILYLQLPAQNVGSGPSIPDINAGLKIDSDNRGSPPPSYNISPARVLLVFDTPFSLKK